MQNVVVARLEEYPLRSSVHIVRISFFDRVVFVALTRNSEIPAVFGFIKKFFGFSGVVVLPHFKISMVDLGRLPQSSVWEIVPLGPDLQTASDGVSPPFVNKAIVI